jgi:hypothetical protein
MCCTADHLSLVELYYYCSATCAHITIEIDFCGMRTHTQESQLLADDQPMQSDGL